MVESIWCYSEQRFQFQFSSLKLNGFSDHSVQEKVLENSPLDQTIIRPFGFTDKNDNNSGIT
jgi:hypothetical protein